MAKENKTQHLEEELKYYIGKILCTADPENPGKFVHFKFNHIFIFFGFTGSGKDTIIDGYLKKNKKYAFTKFIRTLTRNKRGYELDLFDGFYVNKRLFKYLKSHHRFFHHYKKYGGKEFGYDTMHLIFDLSRSNVIMIGGHERNYEGLTEGIKSIFNEIPITTIFVNAPKQRIIKYLKQRDTNPEETKVRILNIKQNWYRNPTKPIDYFIWNDNLKESVRKFKKIVEKELQTPKRNVSIHR